MLLRKFFCLKLTTAALVIGWLEVVASIVSFLCILSYAVKQVFDAKVLRDRYDLSTCCDLAILGTEYSESLEKAIIDMSLQILQFTVVCSSSGCLIVGRNKVKCCVKTEKKVLLKTVILSTAQSSIIVAMADFQWRCHSCR